MENNNDQMCSKYDVILKNVSLFLPSPLVQLVLNYDHHAFIGDNIVITYKYF